jgi:hypothetical protein
MDAPLCDVTGQAGHDTSVASWHMLAECSTAWGSLGIIAQFRLTSFSDEFSGLREVGELRKRKFKPAEGAASM